jgi:hypothetical protein
MIRTASGLLGSRRRPKRRRTAPTPPQRSISARAAASSPSGKPEPELPPSSAQGTPGVATKTRRSIDAPGRRAARACARDDPACWSSPLRVSMRVARRTPRARVSTRLPTRRRSARRDEGRAGRAGACARGRGCAEAPGPPRATASTAVAAGSAEATAGAAAGTGPGGAGGAVPPRSPGGSGEPDVAAGRKSSGSRYPCSSAVFRTPR